MVGRLKAWLSPSVSTVERSAQGGSTLATALSSLSSSGASAHSRQFGLREAVGAPTYNPAVAREVDLLAYRIATAPCRLRNKRNGQDVESHPFLDFLAYGNPFLNGATTRFISRIHYESAGEYLWMLVRDSDRAPPKAYFPIPPHWIKEIPSDRSRFFRIEFGGSPLYLPPEMVFWHRNPNPENPYGRGRGKVITLADEIDTDEYTAGLIKHTLLNKGFIDLLVAVSGSNADSVRRMEMQYNNRSSGFQNSGRAMFMNGDKITVERVTQSFEEMKLLEMRNFAREEIRQTFGTPPELHGQVSNSNRSTIDNALYIQAISQLDPRLNMEAQAYTNVLLPLFKGGDQLEVYYESLAPEDFDRKLKVMQAAPFAITVDEWRTAAGLEPWGGEEGEKRYAPAGMISVTDRPVAPPLPPSPVTGGSKALSPRQNKALSDEQIDALLGLIKTRGGNLTGIWKDMMEDTATQELLGVGSTVDPSTIAPKIASHVREFAADRITGIDETTKAAIREVLAQGVEEGIGPRQMATKVRKVFKDASTRRATMIARTEVLRSSNAAKWIAWTSSGVELEKTWIETDPGGPNAREQHQEMGNRKPIPITQPFILPDGTSMMHPGDGPASHVINCRCTHTARPVGTEGMEVGDRTSVWKAYDKESLEWIDIAEPLFRREFEYQEELVLEYLLSI